MIYFFILFVNFVYASSFNIEMKFDELGNIFTFNHANFFDIPVQTSDFPDKSFVNLEFSYTDTNNKEQTFSFKAMNNHIMIFTPKTMSMYDTFFKDKNINSLFQLDSSCKNKIELNDYIFDEINFRNNLKIQYKDKNNNCIILCSIKFFLYSVAMIPCNSKSKAYIQQRKQNIENTLANNQKSKNIPKSSIGSQLAKKLIEILEQPDEMEKKDNKILEDSELKKKNIENRRKELLLKKTAHEAKLKQAAEDKSQQQKKELEKKQFKELQQKKQELQRIKNQLRTLQDIEQKERMDLQSQEKEEFNNQKEQRRKERFQCQKQMQEMQQKEIEKQKEQEKNQTRKNENILDQNQSNNHKNNNNNHTELFLPSNRKRKKFTHNIYKICEKYNQHIKQLTEQAKKLSQ